MREIARRFIAGAWRTVDVEEANGGSQPITDPTEIANCILWLDASTLALTDNDPVAIWPDGSVSGFDAVQATGDNQPTFKAAVQNGLGVVRYGDWNVNPEFLLLPAPAL